MYEQKACFNCIYGKFERGPLINFKFTEDSDESQSEVDLVECQNEKVSNEVFADNDNDDYIAFALKCGYYNPIIICHCGNCNKVMNTPLYDQEIWGIDLDDNALPMCSEKCKIDYEEKN